MSTITTLPPLYGEGPRAGASAGGAVRDGAQFSLGPTLAAPQPSLPTSGEGETRRMRETAERFEASFLSQMLKPMFEGLSTDGLFGGGEAEATWRSFLIDEMARQTVRAGGIGLADTVMAEMIRMQSEQGRQSGQTLP